MPRQPLNQHKAAGAKYSSVATTCTNLATFRLRLYSLYKFECSLHKTASQGHILFSKSRQPGFSFCCMINAKVVFRLKRRATQVSSPIAAETILG